MVKLNKPKNKKPAKDKQPSTEKHKPRRKVIEEVIQEIEAAESGKNSLDSSKAPKGAGDLDKSSNFESIEQIRIKSKNLTKSLEAHPLSRSPKRTEQSRRADDMIKQYGSPHSNVSDSKALIRLHSAAIQI